MNYRIVDYDPYTDKRFVDLRKWMLMTIAGTIAGFLLAKTIGIITGDYSFR